MLCTCQAPAKVGLTPTLPPFARTKLFPQSVVPWNSAVLFSDREDPDSSEIWGWGCCARCTPIQDAHAKHKTGIIMGYTLLELGIHLNMATTIFRIPSISTTSCVSPSWHPHAVRKVGCFPPPEATSSILHPTAPAGTPGMFFSSLMLDTGSRVLNSALDAVLN